MCSESALKSNEVSNKVKKEEEEGGGRVRRCRTLDADDQSFGVRGLFHRFVKH